MPQSSAKSSTKRKGFFAEPPAREDEAARQREVAALLAPRRLVMQDVPLERIKPNPFQARQRFTNLEDLCAAIQAQGFITRLRIRPDPEQPGYFQLAFGERRLRAARMAGLTEVPCEVAEHSDDELLEIGLAENIQRKDLEPLDEARAFRLFIDRYSYSIRRLAGRIGKDKGYIQDRLALLNTPEDVQKMIEQRPDALRMAREIAKLPTPEERRPLIESVMEGRINTDDVRSVVRSVTMQSPVLTTAAPDASFTTGTLADSTASTIVESSTEAGPGIAEVRELGEQGSRDVTIDGVVYSGLAPHRVAGSEARLSSKLSKPGANPATLLRRDMNTLRVILARWQRALPDMTGDERSTLEDCVQELEGACARLRIDLSEPAGSMLRDPVEN